MTTATEAIVLTEPEWLEYRKGGIGASEVIAALGMSPWKSAYTLWAEKTGKLKPEPVTGIAVELGHFLEPFLAQKYAEETGRRVTDPGDFTVYAHPDHPWLRCTPDKFVDFEPEDGPLETKTTGEFAAKLWADGDAPVSAHAQLQIQMLILDATRGSIAGLIGNRSFHWLDVDRDDQLCARMLAKLSEFWDRVLAEDPPPVDGSVSTRTTLDSLHPDDSGETVELTEDLDFHRREIEIHEEKIKDIKKYIEQHKNQIRADIGAATFGRWGNLCYSLKTQQRKDTIKVALDVEDALIEAGIEFEHKTGAKSRKLRKTKA